MMLSSTSSLFFIVSFLFGYTQCVKIHSLRKISHILIQGDVDLQRLENVFTDCTTSYEYVKQQCRICKVTKIQIGRGNTDIICNDDIGKGANLLNDSSELIPQINCKCHDSMNKKYSSLSSVYVHCYSMKKNPQSEWRLLGRYIFLRALSLEVNNTTQMPPSFVINMERR